MVGFLSSLRTARDPRSLDTEAFRIPPRSTEPLDFPRPKPQANSAGDLARMIESEIIPRLMMAHAPATRAEPPPPAGTVGPRTLEAFMRMTLSSDAPVLTDYVETLIQGGLSLEEVYVDLLIPTARRLGDDWNEDVISFAEVTIGLSRLQQVVRTIGRHGATAIDEDQSSRSAYFAPAVGERHAFGLFVLEDCFRRAGWRTCLDTAGTWDAAARGVHQEWFDLVGLSAAADTTIDAIRSLIAQIRAASCNPSVFVMVGGRLFNGRPDLADAVGADAASQNADEALSIADRAIKPRAFV